MMQRRLQSVSPKKRGNEYAGPSLSALMMLGLAAGAGDAAAQVLEPPVIEDEVAAPIEIPLTVEDGEIECRPPAARLPALEPLDIRVRNDSERPIVFTAPDFFEAADVVEDSALLLNTMMGGFQVGPQSVVRILLEAAPPPGEYGYTCHEPGEPATPETAGVLVVLPVAEPE